MFTTSNRIAIRNLIRAAESNLMLGLIDPTGHWSSFQELSEAATADERQTGVEDHAPDTCLSRAKFFLQQAADLIDPTL